MADYIEPVKIEELPDSESLEESDFFIVEDTEATKKVTIEKLKESIGGIDKITPYFAKSQSSTFYPSQDDETVAVLGLAVLGEAVLGDSGLWETEIPETTEDDYLWISLHIDYADGTSEWTHPFTVTDSEARQALTEFEKDLDAVRADILKNSELIAENAQLLEEVSEKAAKNTEQIEVAESSISDIEERLKLAEEEIENLKNQIEELSGNS